MKPRDLLASKYRLEHVLGSGGMGEVWAAVNVSTGRPVAIKLMQSSTRELRSRMLREARAVGSLKHENIVEIYNVGETEGGDPFLVMERLSGETLDDRLKRGGSLAPAKAVEIGSSIAAALKVAHEKGIVHRDLKPANVFLHRKPEGDGEIVKVLDFGVSKHLQETASTITGGLVGSPAYMSPEQARAEPNIDARSDLWSLGVVLFEMLSGRRPFPSSSPYLVITEVITGPIPSIAEAVPGLSPSLVHVVERCLTRDVDARMGSADELIRLLGPSLPVDSSPDAEPTVRLEVAAPSARPRTKERRPPDASTTTPLPVGREDTATIVVSGRAAFGSIPADAGTTAPLSFDREDTATIAVSSRAPFGSIPTDAGTTAPLPVGREDAAPISGGDRAAIGSIPTATGTAAPLVLGGEDTTTVAGGDLAAAGPVPKRASSKVIVAVAACAAAVLLFVMVGVARHRAPPAAESATVTAASTALPEAVNTVAPAIAQPVVTTAAEASASADPATLPQLGKTEAMIVIDAPEATLVSLDGKRIGTVPVAPMVVPPGSHRLFFKHPTLGERVMVVSVQAGETSLAAAQFENDVGSHPQAPRRAHASGERRLVMP